MKLQNNKFFNLFDTNGRRSDIINAYCVYINIIDKLNISSQNPWKNWPNSIVQFEFYKQALEQSTNVFTKHPKFDFIQNMLKNDKYLKKNFFDLNNELKNNETYKDFFINLDKNIEARSRHYTSNLVKMGFINTNREITEVGYTLLHPDDLKKDLLEELLPINNINLILLRQLSKLLIFDSTGTKYYWPFGLALYMMLINNGKVEQQKLENLLQIISPNIESDSTSAENIIDNYELEGVDSFIIKNIGSNHKITQQIDYDKKIDKNTFYNIFKNGKSNTIIDIYFKFYNLLFDYVNDLHNNDKFKELILFLQKDDNKQKIKKAFSNGTSLFKLKNNINDFLKDNKDHILLQKQNFNINFYNKFVLSKEVDKVKENKNNIGRLLIATGLFHKENGYYKMPLWQLFNNSKIIDFLNKNIIGIGSYKKYETLSNSIFIKNQSLANIFKLSDNDLNSILDNIQKNNNINNIKELPIIFEKERDNEFKKFIHKNFPKEKTFKILSLFKDRKNDKCIQELVTDEANIPTIFEYIVGIAWYYLSDDKDYNLLNSFNLTMNGNYLPLTHAGGGVGDIEIDYKNRKLLIEVTLMNESAQKRGEWEPVLRHSVNLVAEETNKEVLTLFIANKLDFNTINIWRAIASVPLKSTQNNKYISDKIVTIMPLKIDELLSFSNNDNFSSEKFIENINESFQSLSRDFDNDWRENILKK